ncbi:MAG: family 20 glycosylhydrolase, partial [Clostridia bacterium]|nr:family 20 glycosylhydrolase [Clostridia bacterium]
MSYGKINSYLSGLNFHVKFLGTDASPFKNEKTDFSDGEAIYCKWDKIVCKPIEIKVSFDEAAFIDRIVVNSGERGAYTCVYLTDKIGQKLAVHRSETNCNIAAKNVELEAAVITDGFSIVLEGNYFDLDVLSVDIYGNVGEDSCLFPIPRKASYGNYIPTSTFSTLFYNTETSKKASYILKEKYFEKTGIELIRSLTDSASIIFIEDNSLSANAYRLSIKNDRAEIFASDERGFVIAVEAFIKLTNENGVRTAEIEDIPAHPFRGVHMYLPAIHQLEFTKKFIKELISPMGYNVVIIEVAAGMIFDSHPKINEVVADAISKAKKGIWPTFPHSTVAEGEALSKQTVRELVSYIKSFGIEVVPEIQSLGHVPFMTFTYPEIAELGEDETIEKTDTRVEDA